MNGLKTAKGRFMYLKMDDGRVLAVSPTTDGYRLFNAGTGDEMAFIWRTKSGWRKGGQDFKSLRKAAAA